MADPGDLGSLSPLIQGAIAAGIAAGSAIAYVVGKRRGSSSEDTTYKDLLQGIYRMLTEIRTDNARYANEHNQKMDQQTNVLRDIKDRPRAR